jgi:hypothetical protein
VNVRKLLTGWAVIGFVVVALISGVTPAVATSGERLAASSSRAPLWPAPAPDRVVELVRAAGLVPETAESLQYHVHAHLDIFVNGRHQTVPAGIGIVTTDPAVHTGTIDGQRAYGGISVPCAEPCISPLHTHAVTGILHTESATRVDNTLGQFFTEWDVPLTAQCVGTYCISQTRMAVYVNGRRQRFADAAQIPLSDHKEIALVIGRRPSRIPRTADFSQS